MEKKLASKNLEILSELMLVEELACKKCGAYAGMFKDSALGGRCKDLSAHHKARFEALHDYLNSH